MGIWNRLFGEKKPTQGSSQMTIYVFMMRLKGTLSEDVRFTQTNGSISKWTEAIREKVGIPEAKVVLFETADLDFPSIHIEHIEQELPSISFCTDVDNVVKKTLLAQGVADKDIESIIKSESRIVVRNNVSGYVLFLYSPEKSPVLSQRVIGFP